MGVWRVGRREGGRKHNGCFSPELTEQGTAEKQGMDFQDLLIQYSSHRVLLLVSVLFSVL
jgi:hypothetical protein